MTDDPVPGAAMGFGLKLTVTRLPCPEADNEIAELKPFKAVVLIVEVPELPRATVTEVGEALMLKLLIHYSCGTSLCVRNESCLLR
jgi:hypothetical protein